MDKHNLILLLLGYNNRIYIEGNHLQAIKVLQKTRQLEDASCSSHKRLILKSDSLEIKRIESSV